MEISVETISQWKRKYGRIFKVEVLNQPYYYRRLNIGELSLHFNFNVNQIDKEDEIVSSVLIHPIIDLKNSPAGVITFLYKCVISSTGCLDEENISYLINTARVSVDSDFNSDIMTWKLAILQIFPGYTFEHLDEMSLFDFFKLVAICENVTGQKLFNMQEQVPVDTTSKIKKVKDFTSDQLRQVASAEDAADKLLQAYKSTAGT